MRTKSWLSRPFRKELMACKDVIPCSQNILTLFHRFRWVYCQLEVLRQCIPSSVRGILAELPESLDETYERILRQIPKSNRAHAHRLLQCLTVAVRPLRVEELAEVLAVDFSGVGRTPVVDEKLRWEDQEQAVFSVCSSLIAIIKASDSRLVQFSHFSVKEFLTSDRLATSVVDTLRCHHILLEPAHTIMAQACLGVLLQLDKHMDIPTIRSYSLAGYAGEHFGDHAEFENVLSHVADGVDDLLDPDKPYFDTWIWLKIGDWDPKTWHNSTVDPDRRWPFLQDLRWIKLIGNPKYPPQVSPLYYIVTLGYLCLARRHILKRPQDLRTMDDKSCTPLHIAVLAGKVEASQLLIEHTVNFDIRDIEGRTLLHMVAYKGHFTVARMLLEHDGPIKAQLNERDNKGRTALHIASYYHHSSIVALLPKFGADVDAQDNDNMTPLLLAFQLPETIMRNDPKISESPQLLLEHGASAQGRNKNGQTPLHLAVKHGLTRVVELLLKLGADVDAQDNDDMTPLLFASQTDDSGTIAQLLLEYGTNVHIRDKTGRTPLHMASLYHTSSVVELLLKVGADADAQDHSGMTPLFFASRRDCTGADAQLLLEHGASIHMRNKNGQTPLHLASLDGHPRPMALLLKFGADVNAQDDDDMTPLLFASQSDRLGDSAQLLLEHGASIHVQNKKGQTPLHLASQQGNPFSVESLLKAGADVDARDNDNTTPLLLALVPSAMNGRVAKLLLEHGASVHVRNKNGQTPLHLAASRWVLSDIGALMLKLGAEVDAQDNEDMTPLHFAARSDYTGRDTRLLLEHGASVHVRNKTGQTPLHLASEKELSDIVALLLEFGADVDAQDNKYMTPLHYALSSLPQSSWVQEDLQKVIRILLESGANDGLPDEHGKTPLQIAQTFIQNRENDHRCSLHPDVVSSQ